MPLGGLRALGVGFTLATLKLYNQAPQLLLSSNGVALTGHMAEDLVHSSSIGPGSIQNANEDAMNIYVGNLPFTITEDELKYLFYRFRRGHQNQSHHRQGYW